MATADVNCWGRKLFDHSTGFGNRVTPGRAYSLMSAMYTVYGRQIVKGREPPSLEAWRGHIDVKLFEELASGM
jgi:hypothetical protein